MPQPCQLIHTSASPFARKVCIAAQEAGVALELLSVRPNPVAAPADIADANPLGKVPVLRTPDGTVFYDSAVICHRIAGQTALYPSGDAGWRALRREALADGVMDAAVLIHYENTLRPESLRWQAWLDGQMDKILRSLKVMEDDIQSFSAPDIGDIATGCALGYLDFRVPYLDWRTPHPALAAYAELLFARGAFRDTVPA